MKFYNYLTLIGITLLVFLHFCDAPGGKDSLHTQKDTIYLKATDNWHFIETIAPVPYRVEVAGTSGLTLTIPALVDTAAILADYYSKVYYSDSISNDSIKIYLKETISRNRLLDRSLKYKWIAPIMQIRETIMQERLLLYIGADLASNGQNLSFYPGFYIDAKKGMYGLGYDPFNKSLKVGFYGKLKLWKRKK